MGWVIDAFPTITEERQQQIQTFVVENIDQLVQAKSDRAENLWGALTGSYYALTRYSTALSTISSIKSGLRDLYTSEVIWDDGNQQLITYYLPYINVQGSLDIFAEFFDIGWGGEGDDNDTLDADFDDYTIFYYGGNDNVQVSNGEHSVYVNLGEGDDFFKGNGGNDISYGEDGEDIINGGSGNDDLDGGNDNDTLSGGSGNDLIYGADGNDFLKGGNGIDFLDGGKGMDRLIGGQGNDHLIGGDGIDIAIFGSRNNRINLVLTTAQNTGEGIDTLSSI